MKVRTTGEGCRELSLKSRLQIEVWNHPWRDWVVDCRVGIIHRWLLRDCWGIAHVRVETLRLELGQEELNWDYSLGYKKVVSNWNQLSNESFFTYPFLFSSSSIGKVAMMCGRKDVAKLTVHLFEKHGNGQIKWWIQFGLMWKKKSKSKTSFKAEHRANKWR